MFAISDPAEFLVYPPNKIEVVEQNSISLSCKGVGNPLISVQWRLPNKTVLRTNTTFPERYCMDLEGSLFISPVSKDDAGNFVCEISNGIGFSAFATSTLSVHCKKLYPEISNT